MSIETEQLNEAIARRAEEYAAERVPYRHRGTSRRGCDCTGLVIGILREMGYMRSYRLRDYPIDWNLHSGAGDWVIEGLGKLGRRVSRPSAQRGDIAVMQFGRCPAHCGILVDRDLMVHSFLAAGRCQYGRLKDSPWSARWVAAFRLEKEKLC